MAEANTPSTQSVHITGLFPELLGVGGVQEAGRMTLLAAGNIAQSQGWSSRFISLNDPLGAQHFTVAGCRVPFEAFARRKSKFIQAAISCARDAHGAGASVHIILAGHPNLAPIAVWMQKMSPRARAIVMAHGIEVWEPLQLFRRATIRRAHMVTAPSNDTLKKLTSIQKIAPERTRLLPWPLNSEFQALSERSDLRLPPGFPQGTVILTIGRAAAAEQYKGTDSLIRAVGQLRSALPELHLVAVGGGDDLLRLEALARQIQIGDRVHFLQGLSREELAACYEKAAIFAMPSTGEGFGLVFIEAMAFGKPLIAAAAGGVLDLVQDGVNGLLIPPRDLEALTSALRRLLGEATLRTTLGSRGAAIAREKYGFNSFQVLLSRLFEECAVDSTRLP